MKSLADIAKERDDISTILDISSAFEGIASLKISQIKSLVEQSHIFFSELWQIYTQIRVDEQFHFGRGRSGSRVINKELLILVTSEGNLTGDIDKKLIDEVASFYNPQKNDILIIGRHGATQLSQRQLPYVRAFSLPERDRNINVEPIIAVVQKYKSTVIFYQSYVSLMEQEVKKISLSTAVAEQGQKVAKAEEIISERNYIFEPSIFEVVDHLEQTMSQVALSQVILESKLAQYSSRFKAMSAAHTKTDEALTELKFMYSRLSRQVKDERLRELTDSYRSRTA